MPWTRKQVKLFYSKGSPLNPEQQSKFEAELHADPALGHAKKGSAALKKPRGTVQAAKEPSVHAYDWKQHQGRV